RREQENDEGSYRCFHAVVTEWVGSRLDEIAVGLAPLHHLLAVGIEGVVDNPLGGVQGMVVLVTEVTEAFGDGFKPWSFGLMIECVVGVGAIDDLAKENERGVPHQLVFS